MKKAIKIFFSTISAIIILAVMVPILLAMLLQVGPIQKWAADTATTLLSEKAETKFSISKIEIGLFNKVYLEEVFIADPLGDTMIYLKTIDASINGINFFNGKISLGNVTLSDGKVYLWSDSARVMNVQTVFDHFKPKVANPNPPNFRMSATQVNLLNTQLTLRQYNPIVQRNNSINFENLEVNNIDFQAQDVNIFNYDIRLAINHLGLEEKSGFKLYHLSSPECGVNETGMRYENLLLETPKTTLNCAHFNLLYESWYAYNDFVNKVTLDADINPSKIALPTINYFLKDSSLDFPTQITLDGKIIGRVQDLNGTLDHIAITGGTELSGSFNIAGLPNIESTNFHFNLNYLQTNAEAIDTIVKLISKQPLSPKLKEFLQRNKNIHAHGEFYGLLKDFNTQCQVTTTCGTIDAKLQVQPEKAQKGISMIGNVKTINYNLKEALNNKQLNNLSLSASVDATVAPRSINLKTNAFVEKLDFNEYQYHDINMDGEFSNQVFTGNIKSLADSNLIFDTYGSFDFSDPALPAYNFRLNLQKANLAKIGFNKRDSVSIVSANLRAFLTGTNIDNINGNALFDSIYYVNQIDTIHTADIEFFFENSEDAKEISMMSAFADVELKGHNSYSNIFNYMEDMAKTFIPSFNDATAIVRKLDNKNAEKTVKEETYENGFYTLNVKVKEANNVAGIFYPGLEIAQGTNLNFFFNPARNNFSFNLKSDFIQTENTYIESLHIDSRNIVDSLSIYATSSFIDISGVQLPNLSIIGGVKNNRIYLGTRFADPDNNNAALLNLVTDIYRTNEGLPQISVSIKPSNIRLDSKNWIMSQSTILLDSTGVSIDNFKLRSSAQLIDLNGKIGFYDTDTLKLNISDLNLSPLTAIVKDMGYTVKGTATGVVGAVSILSEPRMLASVDFNDVVFGDISLGNSKLRTAFNPSSNKIQVSIKTPDGDEPIGGYYDIAKNNFNIKLLFPNIDLRVLQPLLKGVLANTAGDASANLTLSGTPKTPTLDGKIRINNYKATVDFTKVQYTLSGDVDVNRNRFSLAPTPFNDPEGHNGEISAFFDSHYFKNISFGVGAQFNQLMAINTTSKDNPFFYGKAYGTGSLEINGSERETKIKIAAETALNSSIVLPFSDVSTVDRSTFITFVDPDSINTKKSLAARRKLFREQQYSKIENELDISLDLQVLPNTTALISYQNSLMDNIIMGQGRGRLQMHINPSQEIFTLEGPMNIEKGSYRLIFAIADKTFSLQNGGRLLWTGNPANPNVDFTGVYKVRTSLEPLTGIVGAGNVKTTIDCGIILTETLMNPTISFSIKAPNATPETQNILRNALNTEEALSMQFMSLFVSGTFMPDMGTSGIGTMSGSILSTTGFEFLSNQIESLVSTKNFKIRPTYKPKTTNSSDEIGLQASVSLLEDKIFIEAEGNYTAGPLSNNQRNPFTGEGGITVMLNKAQTLSLKGFTRIIDRFDESQGLQESGVGVYFKQGFQSWDDLVYRYQQYIKKLKEQRAVNKYKREQKLNNNETKQELPNKSVTDNN